MGAGQHVCEWGSVYGAVEPPTGERFVRERPSLHAERVPRFVDAFAQACPDRLNRLLLDNRGAHPAPRLTLPAHGRLMCVPPACPELNPIERVWRALKDTRAWLQFASVAVQQDDVATLLKSDAPPTRPSLTGYASLVAAMHALCL